jgi:serine/threonine-protein kinase
METPHPHNLPSTVILTNRFKDRRAALECSADAAPRAELRAGDLLSRFRILDRVGGGGMGLVYRAQDTELGRTVALKILPPQLCRNPDYLTRFRAEARAHARCNDPHVLTLYSFLELPEGEVLVLEYADGETLAERLQRDGPLSISDALRVFERALLGVEHIHRQGVVHRDLKPSNLFLTHANGVKVMDFGVAKLMDAVDPSPQGAMVGTLLYISPEQINGRETDYRSDIYTLGISLFETLTGRLPFERRTDYALMHAHVQENPPRPRQFHRRIPAGLERVILKAIEKRPERRFQSAAEFRLALLKLGLIERRRPPRAGHEHPAARAPAARRWLGIGIDTALVGATLAIALLLGIWPLRPEPEPARPVPAVAEAARAPKPAPAAAPVAKPPVKRAPAPQTAPPPRAASPERYDSLRQAWGD